MTLDEAYVKFPEGPELIELEDGKCYYTDHTRLEFFEATDPPAPPLSVSEYTLTLLIEAVFIIVTIVFGPIFWLFGKIYSRYA